MTVPIYVFALVLNMVWAFWSDHARQRTQFIMSGFAIAVVGFLGMLISRRHPSIPGVSYFFLFLVAAGLYSPLVCIACLIGKELAPSSKRAVGMGLLVSIGNLGGICGSNIFIAKQATEYPAGFGTGMVIALAAILMAWVLRKAYAKENAKRDLLMTQKTDDEIRAMNTEQELLDLGDKSPSFRYTL